MVTLGLDASTTCVGYAFTQDKKILDMGFIDIKKEKTPKEKVQKVLGFLNESPYIDEVMDSPEGHEGEVHLRGQVEPGSINSSSTSFILIGLEHALRIDFSRAAIPDGFDEGNTIAVKGQLVNEEGSWILMAYEIQTGSPSKYSE